MERVLLIAEKPAAARKIAFALSEKTPMKKNENGVSYLVCKVDDAEIFIVSAVGHLFALDEKEKKGWSYPVFDPVWVPSYKAKKDTKYTKKYLDLIKKLARSSERFIIACDYDVEGEVIGYNILRFACNTEEAQRMKFSTLTKSDLLKAFDNLEPRVNYGMANAGIARHNLDWLYGINLSRALSIATKKAGRMRVMSIGRVQGPALRILAEREKEIENFKPEKYWEIYLEGIAETKEGEEYIEAKNKRGEIFEKAIADEILKKTTGKEGIISDVSTQRIKRLPPTPFDLTTLQTEAYRVFKFSPKKTLDIAQDLYLKGYTSYPRTSSQKLPPTIGYKKIIDAIGKIEKYNDLCNKLLKKNKLYPMQGKKEDPAHPAIYPTGVVPKKLDTNQEKIYDLIVKRFLASFGDQAYEQNTTITISIEDEKFVSSGKITIEEGWYEIYAPYIKSKREVLPDLSIGQKIKNKKIRLDAKETQPPKRYSQSSLLKELEKRGLGTKATRAAIIETLLKRHYVIGNDALKCTEFGLKTVEVLKKNCEDIVSVELTRHFESELDDIMNNKKTVDSVIDEAKKTLSEILDTFKKKELEIGKELIEANKKAEKKASLIGKCPVCKQGNLVMKEGKYGKFIACERYPDCKANFALPSNALIEPSDDICSVCGYPMVKVIKKGKRPITLCINPQCPSKKSDSKTKEDKAERKCPVCGKPLVLRKSLYGEFYGCSGFPKCKYTEQIDSNSSYSNSHSLKKNKSKSSKSSSEKAKIAKSKKQ